MKIMPTRYENLELYLEGLKQTGQPLVQHNGSEFVLSTGDTIGTYYFVPKIAELFNLKLDTSINLFFGFIIAFSYILGNVFLFLIRNAKLKIPREWMSEIHQIIACSFMLEFMITPKQIRDASLICYSKVK